MLRKLRLRQKWGMVLVYSFLASFGKNKKDIFLWIKGNSKMTKDIRKGYCVRVLIIKKPREMLHISRLKCEKVCYLSGKLRTEAFNNLDQLLKCNISLIL